MSMGSVPNCRKEIANRYSIRWFKWKLKPPNKFTEVWGVSATHHFFFILTLHTLRQCLGWPLISFLTSQPKHGTCSSPSKKNSQNFTSRPITRKLLITEILKRWLLVGKKVPYKFPNDIASKLLTLHATNWWFICQPQNNQFFEWP